jgi:hypothetical protein
MMKRWTSPIYAFYDPVPEIGYAKGRRYHAFQCGGKSCRFVCKRFLDKGDLNSTGNLRRHATKCWGEEALRIAEEAIDIDEARKAMKLLKETGNISIAFERKGKGKITYSTRQHTRTETRVELVRWVAQSFRPFKIVSDPGFQTLMKTGRPGYYLPSPATVAWDVKTVFAKACSQIAKLLQV